MIDNRRKPWLVLKNDKTQPTMRQKSRFKMINIDEISPNSSLLVIIAISIKFLASKQIIERLTVGALSSIKKGWNK